MNVMKKIVCMVLSALLSFSLCIPAFAMANKKEYLEEKGFPADFLERRTASQIEEIYTVCLEENLKFDSTKVTTLKEFMADNATMPIGSISEEDMSLEITPMVSVFSDDEIDYVRVFVFYEWAKGKPWILKDDAISVNWDPDVLVYDDSFKLTCYSDDNVYDEKSRPDKAAQGGIGVFTELYATAGVLSGTCTFKLTPKTTPMYLAKRTDTGRIAHTMNVEYVHDKNIGVNGVSFVVKGVEVSISSQGSYDEASDTITSYYKKNK